MSSTWMVRVAGTIFLLHACCSCASWPRGFLFYDPPPPTAFETNCGLKVFGPRAGEPALPESWTPDAVNYLEARALKAFERLADPRFATSCTRLKGWTVLVVDAKNFNDRSGTLVGGDTDCGMGRIFIGNSAPEVGRLAHELAHAVQACDPIGDGKIYLDVHLGWEPIFAALAAEGLPQ